MVSQNSPYLTVEVKPTHTKTKSTSSTPPSSPGKAVRFVHCVTSEPHGLTHQEQWALYHFEAHARQCPSCFIPSQVYAQRRELCSVGYGLALSVDLLVHLVDGIPCSTIKENQKHIRVKLPSDYTQTPDLLAVLPRMKRRWSAALRSDGLQPVLAERRPTEGFVDGPIIREVSPKKSHKTHTRASSLESNDTLSTASRRELLERLERRGSIYDSDGGWSRRAYRVEVREPEHKDRKSRHSSGVWK